MAVRTICYTYIATPLPAILTPHHFHSIHGGICFYFFSDICRIFTDECLMSKLARINQLPPLQVGVVFGTAVNVDRFAILEEIKLHTIESSTKAGEMDVGVTSSHIHALDNVLFSDFQLCGWSVPIIRVIVNCS